MVTFTKIEDTKRIFPFLFIDSGEKLNQTKYRANFNRAKNHGISIGAQFGGSGKNRIMVADKDEKIIEKNESNNIVELSANEAEANFQTLIDIIRALSNKAKGVIRIVASVAGFTTLSQPDKFEAEGKTLHTRPGLLYLTNINTGKFGKPYLSHDHHNDASNEPRYINLFNAVKRALNDHTSLEYFDESNQDRPLRRKAKVEERNKIIFEVQNDTVTVGASAAAKAAMESQPPRNWMGIVCGSGFNNSFGIEFNDEDCTSKEIYNRESGQSLMPTELFTILDINPLGSINKLDPQQDYENKDIRAEVIFAGGSDKNQDERNIFGIRRQIRNLFLYDARIEHNKKEFFLNLAKEINDKLKEAGFEDNDYLFDVRSDSTREIHEAFINLDKEKAFNFDNKSLTDIAAQPIVEENKLIKALYIIKFHQMAQYFIHNAKETSHEDYLRKLDLIGISGSHIVDSFERVEEVEKAFLKPFQEYNDGVRIFRHTRSGVDGMNHLINAKAALARAAI